MRYVLGIGVLALVIDVIFANNGKLPPFDNVFMICDCFALLYTGAVYGTYEAIRYKVPGLLKIRYIGQTTVGSAAIFGLFLGAGSLIHCGKSY
nr:uncharacterized protein LOC107279222 [Oryza sativa Japonica Group]